MNVTLSIQVPVEQQTHMMRWLSTLNNRAPECFTGCRFQIDVSYNLDIQPKCKETRPPRLSRKPGEKPKGKKRRGEQDSGDQSTLTSKEGSSAEEVTNTSVRSRSQKLKEHSNSTSGTNPETANLTRDPRFFRDYQRVKSKLHRYPQMKAIYCYAEQSGRSPYPRLRGPIDAVSQFKGFYNIAHENWWRGVQERIQAQNAPEVEQIPRPPDIQPIGDAPNNSQSECNEDDRARDTGRTHTDNDIMTSEFAKQLEQKSVEDRQAASEEMKLMAEIINFNPTVNAPKPGSRNKRRK